MKRKILILSTTLVVAITMMLSGAVPVFATGDSEVSVEVSIQKGDEFYMAHKQLSVSSKLAEDYGYDDQVEPSKVSALDALVAAHIDRYGADKDVINEKLTMKYGNPDFIMGDRFMIGDTAGYSGFAINEDYVIDETTGSGYNVDSAEVKSGDRLDFFWY